MINDENPYINIEQDEQYIQVGISGNNNQYFSVSNLNTDISPWGDLRRITVDLKNLHTNITETIVSTKMTTFEKKVNRKLKKWDKEHKKREGQKKAKKMTKEAEETINYLKDILKFTVDSKNEFDINILKKNDEFKEKKPKEPGYKNKLNKPDKTSKEKFHADFSIFDFLFKSLKNKKIREYKKNYKNALIKWKNECDRITQKNHQTTEENKKRKAKWKQEIDKWKTKKNKFHEDQRKYNAKYDKILEETKKGNERYLLKYYTIMLNNIKEKFKELFDNKYLIDYKNGIFIINYYLPTFEELPTLENVKYIISRDELKEKHLSKTKKKKLYDKVLYGITLSIIYKVFFNDKWNLIQSISFNGKISDYNKKTGNKQNKCVLSIQVQKEEFQTLNLEHVEPKECFKGLKGISGGKLINLTPVQPILEIDKEDDRFIDGKEILDGVNTNQNLAAMDWQDFEHLTRELFEKEFSQNGGEVNITQSSRDKGVDAIAFDPDPIRGGKIVLQAKRYTNTVGVNAVRDLYGTLIDEGANRGILITTSSYGSASHDFVKDKPISLLNGQKLLYLLKKHGYSAKIDIEEAKKLNEF